MILDEAQIVSRRLNRLMVAEALLIQAAVSSMFSDKGGKHFSGMIKRLTDGQE